MVELCGQSAAIAWIPKNDATVRIPASGILLIDETRTSRERISYVTAAGIADVLERDILIAHLEASVVPPD